MPDRGPGAASDDRPPSKTRRKHQMHALQDLGHRLTELGTDRLAQLALPEELTDALRDYRRFTKWEAKRRQMQFIGRLMRDIDPAPIAAQLDAWQHTSRTEVAGFHEAEAWRDRLLAATDGDALERLLATHRSLERQQVAELVDKARTERAAGRTPASARLLFRAIARAIEADRANGPDAADAAPAGAPSTAG